MKNKIKMRLHLEPFLKIKSGQKTIELRVKDEKRSKVKIGHKIEFVSRENGEIIRIVVEKLTFAKNFEELLQKINIEELGIKKEQAKTFLESLEEYYSKEEQEKNSVMAIKFLLLK